MKHLIVWLMVGLLVPFGCGGRPQLFSGADGSGGEANTGGLSTDGAVTASCTAPTISSGPVCPVEQTVDAPPASDAYKVTAVEDLSTFREGVSCPVVKAFDLEYQIPFTLDAYTKVQYVALNIAANSETVWMTIHTKDEVEHDWLFTVTQSGSFLQELPTQLGTYYDAYLLAVDATGTLWLFSMGACYASSTLRLTGSVWEATTVPYPRAVAADMVEPNVGYFIFQQRQETLGERAIAANIRQEVAIVSTWSGLKRA